MSETMGGMYLPPGFRFHPTDEELVSYYLKRKVDGLKIELEVIPEIELYKFNPWDLPDKSFLPKRDMEWFFFCPRDRKYPNGSRTNRATAAGYWKATGKDRQVVCNSSVIGLRKTLVFYCGRAPLGDRSDWVMHEYRLCGDPSQGSSNFQGAFVLCRVVKKNEHGQKIGDIYGESKSKKAISSSMNDFNQGNFSNKISRTSGESPSPESNLFIKSNDSTPVTSPSEIRRGVEPDPMVIEIDDDPNLLASNDQVSDISKVSAFECLFPNNIPNSVTTSQPRNLMASPSPSYFMEEVNLADDLSRMGFMPPYTRPTTSLGMDEDAMFQSFEWPGYPGNMNPLSDGCEAWNTMVSPSICRQTSGDGSFGELTDLWQQDDNLVIVM
ncbi:NAC domain-containing protein 71-like [Magnolia sinica]|uniref:NAC domain-containing protein 71-like n=1 Tax=Magnolia sinica TaxID=86752 RepID=UPI002658214D|nr:NAC domain-containing protein 71-like [Magnolia sinica]